MEHQYPYVISYVIATHQNILKLSKKIYENINFVFVILGGLFVYFCVVPQGWGNEWVYCPKWGNEWVCCPEWDNEWGAMNGFVAPSGATYYYRVLAICVSPSAGMLDSLPRVGQ